MRFLIIFGILFFSTEVLLSQETSDKERDREVLFVQQISLESLTQNNNSTNGLSLGRSLDNRQFVISQIGEGNLLNIKAGANDFQTVRQTGAKNYYNFIDYYNSRESNMNVLQEGTANSLHIYGTNSFTDKIKIYQKSDYKSIIIRNF